jgi:hypothetical protein
MWIMSQVSHAIHPDSLRRPMSATAFDLPTVARLRDRLRPAHRGEAPLVAVAERLRRPPLETPDDRPGDVVAGLHRGGRHARHRAPVVARHRGHVADHEYLGMPRHAQVGIDQDAAGAIERRAQRAHER